VKLSDRVVLWPRYLDGTRAKSAGRRLPKRLCVERPKLQELATVAGRLGLSPEIRETAADPRRNWEHSGYVIVDKRGSKTRVLLLLAEALIRERAGQR